MIGGQGRASFARDGQFTAAERVGFEPTDHLAAVNALAGRPIRPLWHLSREVRSLTIDRGMLIGPPTEPAGAVSLSGGTVAERTIAPALKAGGREARGFESLPFR